MSGAASRSLEEIAGAAFDALRPAVDSALQRPLHPSITRSDEQRLTFTIGIGRDGFEPGKALVQAIERDPALGTIIGKVVLHAGGNGGAPITADAFAGSLLSWGYELGDVSRAIADFRALATENAVDGVAVTYVAGLSLRSAIRLGDTCALVPASEAPGWHVVEAATRGIPGLQAPWFGGPAPTAAVLATVRREPLFVSAQDPNDLLSFITPTPPDIVRALLAASLTSAGCAFAIGTTSAHTDPRLAHLPLGHGMALPYPDRTGRAPQADADAARLLDVFKDCLAFQGSLEPLVRFASFLRRSRQGRLLSDRAIDLGTALEVLLTFGGSDDAKNQEISYKLRTRLAWLAGSDIAQRRELSGLANALYALRSKAAHGSHVPDDTKLATRRLPTSDILDVGAEVCALAAISVLKIGSAPNWNDLVLGMDVQRQDHAALLAKLRRA